jgi:endo-1,4-beta-D-glucanase Y
MKKAFLVSLFCAIAVIGFAQSLGDVNNSGTIDIVDALLVAQYYVGLNPANFNSSVADVNCSGSIDIVDALLCAQYYVGLISSFPCSVTNPPTAVPTVPPTAAPTNAPVTGKFPYAGKPYPYGLASASTNQASDNSYVQSEWNSFKSTYVTSNGAGGNLRVQRPDQGNDTVSEGIGYGMLLAVYMDDQTTLNGLWAYAKARRNAHGVMNWRYDSSGNVTSDGANGATDGDEDMALALIFANKKWGGSTYQADATALCQAVLNYEVEASTYVLKPGDMWGGSNCTNISYYSPGAYKVFASFTGNSAWNNVVTKCYQVINAAKNQNTGLIPDWCTAAGGSTSEVTWDSYKDHYYYDAVRFPMRIAWDLLWFGDSSASGVLTKITTFFAGQGATNIKGGYYLDGSVIGNYHDAGFLATAGAGAMGGGNTAFAQACLADMKNTKANQYFQDCLRMISLLVVTGNFPNLLTY